MSFSLLIVLTGCPAFVPTANLHELTPEERHGIGKIKIYNPAQLHGVKFDVADIVEGNSCQNKLYDPPATRTAAIEQLKYYAHQLGADGITNIVCSGREGTSTRTNCWELISCTAEAIHVTASR